MGLHGEIKKKARALWAPHAFHRLTETLKRSLLDQSVHILDYLTSFQTLLQERPTGEEDEDGHAVTEERTFTHQEIFECFWNACYFPGAALTIVLMDDRSRTPKQKVPEQLKRQDSAAKLRARKGRAEAVPYPANARFVPAGLSYVPEGEQRAVVEPICLRRLAKSRFPHAPSNLGNTLWDSFHGPLQRKLDGVHPFEHRIVLVTQHGSHLLFRSRKPMVALPGSSLHFGEADPALIHHTWLLEQVAVGAVDPDTRIRLELPGLDRPFENIHWHTTDSDVIALFQMHWTKRTRRMRERTRIWWHCDENELVVDMDALVVQLSAFFELPPHHMARALVLCGTDFVEKAWLSHLKGVECILEAYKRTLEELGDTRPSLAFLWTWMRHLWTLKKVYEPRKKKKKTPEEGEDDDPMDAVAASASPECKRVEFHPLGLGALPTIQEIRAVEERKFQQALARFQALTLKENAAVVSAAAAVPLPPSPEADDEEEQEEEEEEDNHKRKTPLKKKKDRKPPVLHFPIDEVILQGAARWMWNCEYWDNAYCGEQSDEAELEKQVRAQYTILKAHERQTLWME